MLFEEKMKEDNLKRITNQYMETEDHSRIRIYVDRPQIDYRGAMKKTIIHLLGILIFSAIIAKFLGEPEGFSFTQYIVFVFAFSLIVLCIKMKLILIWLIKIYQSKAKIETRLKCCFEPSCSEYAILALEKYGLIRGVLKSINRLKRCHPPGGVDYP